MSWSIDRQNGKIYLYHKEPKIDWGAILSVQQKEGEHGKLLIKTEKNGKIVKLSNFGADITDTSKALKPITGDVLDFVIKMEKLINAYQPPSSREIGSNKESGHGTWNTCNKNGHFIQNSYSEDETSSIDLFSKTLVTSSPLTTTSSHDTRPDSRESKSSKKRKTQKKERKSR